MADVEVHGLAELTAALSRAEARAVPEVGKVVDRGALNIKRGWADRWQGIAHAPALPAAISYDRYHVPGAVAAEIGPDKDKRQGALGNIIEYGTVNNAPRPGGGPALEDEAPRFQRALGDLGSGLLGGGR